jgi:hypothetical protein
VHRRDLLLLIHNDLLGDVPELLVMAIAQEALGHVDGA